MIKTIRALKKLIRAFHVLFVVLAKMTDIDKDSAGQGVEKKPK